MRAKAGARRSRWWSPARRSRRCIRRAPRSSCARGCAADVWLCPSRLRQAVARRSRWHRRRAGTPALGSVGMTCAPGRPRRNRQAGAGPGRLAVAPSAASCRDLIAAGRKDEVEEILRFVSTSVPESAVNPLSSPSAPPSRFAPGRGFEQAERPFPCVRGGSTTQAAQLPHPSVRGWNCFSPALHGDSLATGFLPGCEWRYEHARPFPAHHGACRGPLGGRAAVSGRPASPRQPRRGRPEHCRASHGPVLSSGLARVSTCARSRPVSAIARPASPRRSLHRRRCGARPSCRAAARRPTASVRPRRIRCAWSISPPVPTGGFTSARPSSSCVTLRAGD